MVREALLELSQRESEVEISYVWTCGGILVKEVGRIVELTQDDVILCDRYGNRSTVNLYNIVEVVRK